MSPCEWRGVGPPAQDGAKRRDTGSRDGGKTNQHQLTWLVPPATHLGKQQVRTLGGHKWAGAPDWTSGTPRPGQQAGALNQPEVGGGAWGSSQALFASSLGTQGPQPTGWELPLSGHLPGSQLQDPHQILDSLPRGHILQHPLPSSRLWGSGGTLPRAGPFLGGSLRASTFSRPPLWRGAPACASPALSFPGWERDRFACFWGTLPA